MSIRKKIEKFMALDPSDEQIENFYCTEILSSTEKRSIQEILNERK